MRGKWPDSGTPMKGVGALAQTARWGRITAGGHWSKDKTVETFSRGDQGGF